MGIRFETHDAGEVKLNLALSGDPSKPLIICLHGFPEYWAAWAEVMAELADDYFLVAPDQRGFNLSSKPLGVDAYQTKHMVADLFSIAQRYSPTRPFILAGHDWGASVAYAFAMSHPKRLSHLVIANGVHPLCFQRAIFIDKEQRLASQYMNRLRATDAEEILSENGYGRLIRMVEGFSVADFLSSEMRDGYLRAWRQEGALTAMLNWYRASPIIVPEPGEAPAGRSILDLPHENFVIAMPHLLIWGEEDQALRPSSIMGLDTFANNLRIERLKGASHWVLHEKPRAVAAAMRAFLKA